MNRLHRTPIDVAASPRDELLLLTWNALADQLHDAFPHVPQDCLRWDARGPKILTELTDTAPFGRLPDLICLQEIDRYDDTLRAPLEALGYRAELLPKAPGRDGLALLHRSPALELLHLTPLRYRNPDTTDATQVALLARFTRPDGRTLLVATTHLRAKPGFEEFRRHQAAQLLDAVAAHRHPNDAVLIAGDFNDTPDSPAITAIRDSPLDLTSAYAAAHGGHEPPWTTWKTREVEVRRTIDYVWSSAPLTPQRVLGIPSDDQIPPHRLPDFRYPSDHLHLVASFAWGD